MKTVIEMAREAGFDTAIRKGRIMGFDRDGDYTEEIEHLAELVRDDERRVMLAEQPQQEPVACQYAKDVAMPEYRCVGRCQYDTSPPAQQEPVALQAVYKTIKNWGTGGESVSRRELAQRIVDLYATPPQPNEFNPDWDAMAKRILELEALLERQTARIVDLQTHIDNFDGEDR